MSIDPSKPEPGTGTYVLAWLLAKVAATMVSSALAYFALSNVYTVDAILNRLMLIVPFSAVFVAAAMIGIYALFPGIRIVKVMPYLWGLGALGVVITVVQTAASGIPYPGLYYGLLIGEFVLTMLALAWGFRRMGRL